jgi:hypothetical protein
MSQRGIVVLLVALVVLGALVVFGQRDHTPPSTSGAVFLPELQSALNDVQSVTITKSGNEKVATLEKSGDAWVVAEKNRYPADLGKLRQGLRALAEAKVLETKTSNPEFYDKLGVQDVAGANATGLAVTLSAPGKSFGTLILGDAHGTKQRYVRRAAEPQSYLLDHNPDFPKNTAQWLDARILDVRGERIQQVTIKHPDGETVTISKREAPAADLTPGTVVNFDVANVPKGRELLYPGVANVIGNSLRELNLEDVERADASTVDRPVVVEFKTFDGLVVRATGSKRGDEDWVSFEASVDNDQAARFAKPAPAPTPASAEGGGDTKPAAAPAEAEAKPAAPSSDAAAPADKPDAEQNDAAAEAKRINDRVAGWRYKIAGYQYDQMTRRMADLLKPVA